MPGYDVVCGDVKPNLCCPYCHLVIRKAYQNIETGERCCYGCIPDDADRTEYYCDRAADKEIKSLSVTVRCNHCKWKGPLNLYLEVHEKKCLTSRIWEEVTSKYMLETCSLKQENSMLRQEVSQLKGRLAAEGRARLNLIHSHGLAESLEGDSLKSVLAKAETVVINCLQWTLGKKPLSPSVAGTSGIDGMCTSTMQSAGQLNRKLEVNRAKREQLAAAMGHLRKAAEAYEQSRALGGFPSSEPSEMFFDFSASARPPPNQSSMQCRWILPNISKLMTDAVSRPGVPQISQPWSTYQCGYLLRAYIFLNGHGRCIGTHVSVFMSVLRGLHDDTLRWPLRGTLCFAILDRKFKNSRVWSKAYSSDPESEAFWQCLKTEKEPEKVVASGASDFIKIDKFLEYIKDDSVFFEFSFREERM